MDFGIIGEEINTYKLSIPYLDLKLKELSINNSNSILVNNSTPEYIEKSYNIYGTSKQAAEQAEKTEENKNNKQNDLKNEYFIQIGNPDIFAFTASGCNQMQKLSEQLPNTANAVSMAATIAGQIFNSPPDVLQKAKGLADSPIPSGNNFYIGATHIGSFFDHMQYKAFMPQKKQINLKLIDIDKTCNPGFYANFNAALPDIAGLTDSLLSVGGVFDPIGTLTKLFTEQLPKCLNSVACNVVAGIAPPHPCIKPLAFGADNFLSGALGLWQGCEFRTTVNAFESQNSKNFFYANFGVKLDVLPIINVKALYNLYALTCRYRCIV